MKIKSLIAFCSLGVVVFAACKSSEKMAEPMVQTVSYERDIKPIMQRSCAPCHFPEKGRKKHLDTYEAVSANISEIIYMVSLPADNEKFMPFEGKKQALSETEIEMFKLWKKEGKGK
ncbi:hypothetical protein EP331_11435 [bacterium]|nr:MAG: hypothetical protein EP331_11435 [bacterium]